MTDSDSSTSPHDATPRKRGPSDFQRRTFWSAVTALSLLAIGAVSVFVIWVVAKVLQFLQPVLVPLAAAGILAYLLEPLITRLTQRGTPRFRAMVWVFSGFHLLLLFMLLSVVVPTAGTIVRWVGDRETHGKILAGLEQTADAIFEPLGRFFAEDSEKQAAPNETPSAAGTEPTPVDPAATTTAPQHEKPWKQWLKNPENASLLWQKVLGFLNAGFQGFLGYSGYIIGFFMVPFYLYYFLKEADGIRRNWSQYLPLRTSNFKTEVVGTLNEINGYLIAFFRGSMLVSLIDGLLVGIALTILGLPYAALIGMLVALLGLLPYVGTLLCWLGAVIIAVVHFGVKSNRFDAIPQVWAYPLIVSAIFLVVIKLNALVTAPKILGDATGLHPLTVIFSVVFWSSLIGVVLGALLAVPLSASVKVLFRRYIWERGIQSRLGDAAPSANDSA